MAATATAAATGTPACPAGAKSGCVAKALGAPEYKYTPVLEKIKSFQGSLAPGNTRSPPNVAELVKILNALGTDMENSAAGTDRYDKVEFLQMIILMLLAPYSNEAIMDILQGRVRATGDYSQKVLRLRDSGAGPDLIKKNYDYYNQVVTKFLSERRRLAAVMPRRGNLEAAMKQFLNRTTTLSNTNRQKLKNHHTAKIRTGAYDNINPARTAVVNWSKAEPNTLTLPPTTAPKINVASVLQARLERLRRMGGGTRRRKAAERKTRRRR